MIRNQIEAELSVAYLHAIAAKVALAIDVPHLDDDSVDAVISAKGKLVENSELISPRIDVQLKATTNVTINSDRNIVYSLPIKNYIDMTAKTLVPRLLILLILAPDEDQWLIHQPDQLVMKKCAYYLNLYGCQASTNDVSKTVYIPEANILTPEVLRDLMIKVSKSENL